MVTLDSGVTQPPAAWQGTVRLFIRLLTAGAALLVLWTAGADVQRKRHAERQSHLDARAKAVEAASGIDGELKAVEPIVAAVANDLSSGRLKAIDITARASADLAAHDNLFEVGV